jgi:hypothetical protein
MLDMRRVFAFVMVVLLSLPGSSLFAASAAGLSAQSAGAVAGTASNTSGRTMANTAVRVRNLANGQIASTTTTDAVGQFSFSALPAGEYTVEVVNAAGEIIGTSSMISLAAGASVAGVTVTSSVAAASLVAGGAGSFLASTAGIVTLAAAGAAVAAVTVKANQSTASPSR